MAAALFGCTNVTTEPAAHLSPQPDAAPQADGTDNVEDVQQPDAGDDAPASDAAPAEEGDVPIAEGDYALRSAHSGLCLDVPGGAVSNGVKLQQWACNGKPSQTFHLSFATAESYKITNVKSLRSLDVTDESMEAGAALQQWDYWGGGHQQFGLAREGSGVRILARHTGMAVQVAGASVEPGAGVVQQPFAAGGQQLWELVPVEPPPDPLAGFVHSSGVRLLDGAGEPLLLRGVALGNWFLPEGYMWQFDGARGDRARRIGARVTELVGEQNAGQFWRDWRDNFVTEGDIARIAELGFNHVRVAMNARLLLPEGQDAFDEQEFAYLTAVVQWCKSHHVYVILDMHGAPGGQTGKNIDDSPNDYPDLFTDTANQDRLVLLWKEIASRFAQDPTVLGYDLLNEPLPGEFFQHNHQLWPLYVRIGAEIRSVDPNHTLIVEGANWANDWSALDAPFDDNMMYSFHKYWDSTDQSSIQGYLDRRAQWQRPVWVGESGENNNAWYQEAFSLFESNDIGWCFWTWKKLEGYNNPYGYATPGDWWQVQNYVKDASQKPSASVAQGAFDQLIDSIRFANNWQNTEPICSILPCP